MTKWVFFLSCGGKIVNRGNERLIPTILGNRSPIPCSQIWAGLTILIPLIVSILQTKRYNDSDSGF